MHTSFISLLREPDNVRIQTDHTPLRFEDKGSASLCGTQIATCLKGNALQVTLLPCGDPVKRVLLRFRGDQSEIRSVWGDSFERCKADDCLWHAMVPQDALYWYFHAKDANTIHSYGVKTGCNAVVTFHPDPEGITVIFDVRNGICGVQLQEPLLLGELVCREGREGEEPYMAAQDFCRTMCEAPVLPKTPVFGFNNWYWAYGNISQESVTAEARYLASITKGAACKPYMVMDDGWQQAHTLGYNGGPWRGVNERFASLADTADAIHREGALAGIWFRPLMTIGHVPQEAILRKNMPEFGLILDPTHPYSEQTLTEDVQYISDSGFDLLKHDFSTFDLFGKNYQPDSLPVSFYDKSLTNAQIAKKLYRILQDAMGEKLIIGCNTSNHLVAGIHALQRSGDDTSGRVFEWTRRHGIHSMSRLPQNNRFFMTDHDCAAFTDMVDHAINLDFMEAMAIHCSAVFASVTPGSLTSVEEARMHDIFCMLSHMKPKEAAVCRDWDHAAAPAKHSFRGEEKNYHWYGVYDGVRHFLSWME